MSKFNNKKVRLKRAIYMLLTLIMIVTLILSYSIAKDGIGDNNIEDVDKQKQDEPDDILEYDGNEEVNLDDQDKIELSAEWFENYLTPFFRTSGGIEADNLSDDDMFSKAINLAVYLNLNEIEQIDYIYHIKRETVANYVKRYYGIENFVYNVSDDQFQYDETKEEYLSALEFGVGQKDGPVADYTVTNIKYDGSYVILDLLEDYKGQDINNVYSVGLSCINEECIIDSIDIK